MTDRTILQKYVARNGDVVAGTVPQADAEAADDLGAFGWLRGIRDRAVSLELRKKDGNILAVSYGYIEKAEFDPSEGITLSVSGQKLRIKGRNLNGEVRPTVRLFEGIARQRVPWVQETDESDNAEPADKATLIDSIQW
jgi:hypothetical protein